MAKSSSKGKLFLPLIVIVLIIGYATNPSEEEFRDYLKYEINDKTNRDNDGFDDSIYKIFLSATSQLYPVEKNNYYVLSRYKVSFSNKSYVYIGALNHFYMIEKSD